MALKCEVCEVEGLSGSSIHFCSVCNSPFCNTHSYDITKILSDKPTLRQLYAGYEKDVMKKHQLNLTGRLCIYCHTVLFSRVIARARNKKLTKKVLEEIYGDLHRHENFSPVIMDKILPDIK